MIFFFFINRFKKLKDIILKDFILFLNIFLYHERDFWKNIKIIVYRKKICTFLMNIFLKKLPKYMKNIKISIF